MESVPSGNDVTDSLIVLPEAFNLGRQYDLNDGAKERPLLDEQDVLARLREIAKTHKVVFVVGLIEIEARRNSAYLVDAGSPRLMCHKIMNDGSQEYEPCTSNCQGENPIKYREEISVGALICADASDNRRLKLMSQSTVGDPAECAYWRLIRLQSDLKGKRGLVCVPAYMLTTMSDPEVHGSGLILANSRPGGSSFIKDNRSCKLRAADECLNQICLEEIRSIMPQEK